MAPRTVRAAGPHKSPSGILQPARHVREARLRPVVPARLSRASLPCHQDLWLGGESHDPGRQAPPFPVLARPPWLPLTRGRLPPVLARPCGFRRGDAD